MHIILASGSPRRKELLQNLGLEFTVIPSEAEEVITNEKPEDIVEELSFIKAADIAEKCGETDAMIIGADTIVGIHGKVLGKPKDPGNAKDMLRQLQGNVHQVFTGVTVIILEHSQKKIYKFSEKTEVKMYPMTKEEIDTYVATKEPLDKAGAYGIQGKAAAYIEGICGDYNNVVGFPISRFYHEMQKIGIDLKKID